MLVFLQKDIRFWTGGLSFFLWFGEVGGVGLGGWMDGWLVLGEGLGRSCSWVDACMEDAWEVDEG